MIRLLLANDQELIRSRALRAALDVQQSDVGVD